MNRELRELLGSSGVWGAADWPWHRMVLTRNGGAIRPGRPGRRGVHYGFDFLLLDEEFRPRYYGKVRPARDPGLERESSVLGALSRDERVSSAVPRVWSSATEGSRLQLTGYLDGVPWTRSLGGTRAAGWARELERLLPLADLLSERVAFFVPSLDPAAESVSFREETAPALDHLGQAGLLEGAAPVLEEALDRAGSVRPRIQHGDFWPGNVVSTREGWRAIDFEDFGRVRVPLYDAFHMVRTSDRIRRRPPSDSTWLDRLGVVGPTAVATRRLLKGCADRSELDPPGVVGALLHYLLELARVFHARPAPPSYWEPLVRELHRAASLLRGGEERLQTLLLD